MIDAICTHAADFLVVGGGISGLFAGIRARDFVKNVIVVDKGSIGHTSQGSIPWKGVRTKAFPKF